MLRYRDSNGGVTQKSRKAAKKNLAKVGGVREIRGYRFTATRKLGDSTYTTQHECVLVRGDKGTARFEGFLWGYGGEGPRGLVDLLQACGLNYWAARSIAYETPRRDKDGIDWSVRFPVGIPVDTSNIVI